MVLAGSDVSRKGATASTVWRYLNFDEKEKIQANLHRIM